MKEIKRNFQLHKLAKNLIQEYKPDVVVLTSDIHSLFEMYLLRFAGRLERKIPILDYSQIKELVGEKSLYPQKLVDFMEKWRKIENENAQQN